MARLRNDEPPSEVPLTPRAVAARPLTFAALRVPAEGGERCVARSGLVVLPTSLCSSQIASVISRSVCRLRDGEPDEYAADVTDASSSEGVRGLAQYSFVTALNHTEGCAAGYGASAFDGLKNYDRVLVGHLLHPFARSAFLIEHGCEKTLLSYFQQKLAAEFGTAIDRFGQGSVQKEGGIHNAVQHVGAEGRGDN